MLKLLALGAAWGENIVLGSHLAGPDFRVPSGPSFVLPIRQASPLSLDGHSSVRLKEQAFAPPLCSKASPRQISQLLFFFF